MTGGKYKGRNDRGVKCMGGGEMTGGGWEMPWYGF